MKMLLLTMQIVRDHTHSASTPELYDIPTETIFCNSIRQAAFRVWERKQNKSLFEHLSVELHEIDVCNKTVKEIKIPTVSVTLMEE